MTGFRAMSGLAFSYARGAAGVVLVWFGLTIPILVTAVGSSVDIAQAYLVRERLSHALDAAALAAAASASENNADIEKRVQDFINVNYPPDKIGFTVDVDIDNQAETLYVGATARLNTTFMKVFGKDKIDVFAETEVTKEVKAIEVVLVMDVTGSMTSYSGSKRRIDILKDSAKLFVETMFNRVKKKELIKIGLVPYSSSVNVGRYGLGKNPSGTNYDTAFVSNPFNIPYSATDTAKWRGCVVEDDYPKDTLDHEGPWDMYRYCRNDNAAGTPIPNCDTTYNSRTKTYTANRHQNYLCPETPVTPLTNDKTDLLASIKTLKAEGNTYGNIGMVWGYRLISPDFPFREAEPWSNEDWKKAIILMTDGVNQMHSYYSAHGPTAGSGITNRELDNRMLDVCEEMKDKGILVYTITFDKDVDRNTKKLYEDCATQPSMWYDAPNSDRLLEVYLTIAKELSNLHLSK